MTARGIATWTGRELRWWLVGLGRLWFRYTLRITLWAGLVAGWFWQGRYVLAVILFVPVFGVAPAGPGELPAAVG